MESVRIAYKKDDFGNDMFARVSWRKDVETKAIAITYHGGGLLVGSSEIIPKAQIEYLTAHGFVVVAPNYRLCPQVTAKDSVLDCEEAYDWVVSTLPGLFSSNDIKIDSSKVATFGHSTGGTLAMHIASTKPNISACTAFYPTLYAFDPTTSAHHPWTLPAYMASAGGYFTPTDEDWKSITPPGTQLSEAQLAIPGQVPPARNKWQLSLLKNGAWLKTICPDGDYTRIDPLAKLNVNWPPVMIVQGDADDAPGSGLGLAQRAERELRTAGIKGIELEIVKGAGHMFDLPLKATDGAAGWQAVTKGLDWLRSHI